MAWYQQVLKFFFKGGSVFVFLIFALNVQAGVFDFFCVQSDEACQEKALNPATNSTETQMASKNISPPLGSIASSPDCVEVKGASSMEGVDKAFARKMAIRDALKVASLKNNVNIRTDQSVESYQLTLDSTRFTSNSKIKHYSVLKEGVEDPEDQYGQTKEGALNYEVTLMVCLTEEAGICTGLEGNQYQPRLAIAPVVMPFGSDVRDISNVLSGYQLELERRFKQKDHRNLSLLSETIDLQPNLTVFPNLDRALLTDIQNKTGAQFLLLTVIRSAAAHTDTGVLSTAKRFYDIHVSPSTRYLEVDSYIVDLMKKNLVHQSRNGVSIEGKVLVGRNKPFGSNAFFATETGKGFESLLKEQTKEVLDFLHCKPFESQVIDVRDGEYVIYLHEASGAKVGDDLAVYHVKNRPVRFAGEWLGQDQRPGAFLKIKRMMPNFAIAELTAKKGVVQVGDIVKTW